MRETGINGKEPERRIPSVPPFPSFPSSLFLPPHDLQIERADRVERGHEQLSDVVGYDKAADLSVTERLPQRPAVQRQRDQAEDRRANGDHHRAEPDQAGVEQRLSQRRAALAHLLDEIE